jgi:hypothetical protein
MIDSSSVNTARHRTMDSPRVLAFLVLVGSLVGWTVYLGARDIGRGKVSSPEAACFLALIFFFGALTGNFGRSRVLHYLLLSLGCATEAASQWLRTHNSLFPTLWGLLAGLSALSALTTWKARPSPSNEGEASS